MKRKQHARNVVSFILLGALSLQAGCAKTVSTIRPEPHQDPEFSLPLRVRVTLMREVVIHGTYRDKPTTWQTDKISGQLIAWDDELVSLRASGRTHRFDRCEYKVPIAEIEKIEILKTDLEGCVIGGGLAGIGILVIIILAIREGRSAYGEFFREGWKYGG